MNNFFLAILQNKIFLASCLGWLTAQSIKILINVIKERRFNFRWLAGTGGMPSAHAALVMSLATSVGIQEGFSSSAFIVALIFAMIIAFDAQGVRRAAGQQAEVLNMIMDDIYWRRKIHEDRLKELIGHSPFEVFVGCIVGIVIAILVMT